MNCLDFNRLFDAGSPQNLTREQRAAMDRHLASCQACRSDSTSWQEMVALPVPATPPALRGRIAAALGERFAPAPRRSFRPFVIGGLLLAGAALAAAIALQLGQGGEGSTQSVVEVQDEPADPQPTDTASATEPVSAVDTVQQPAAATVVVMDPYRVLVVLLKEAAADEQAVALASRCRDEVVHKLSTQGGLKVIADPAVYAADTASQDTGLSEQLAGVARARGAGKVLAISTKMDCSASLFNTQTRKLFPGAGMGGLVSSRAPDELRVKAFGVPVASMVRYMTPTDPETELADSRAVVLDQTLSDRRRASALIAPLSGNPGRMPSAANFFDTQIVAAAIQLATQSTDADVRGRVWAALRDVHDPALAQPLLQALTSDPDRSVRYQAALHLNDFLDQPGVREGLERAVAADPDTESEVDCCVFTVREAAQRALVPTSDFHNWARSQLFDTSLPVRARLLSVQPSSPDGRWAMLFMPEFGIEAARVVFEIGRNSSTAQARLMAWNALVSAPRDEAFIPVLVSDMTNYPNEAVRAAAAKALQEYAADAVVRAAFNRALDDSSIDVRRAAQQALQRPTR